MNALRAYHMANDDIIILIAVALFVLFTFILYRSRMVIAYKFNTFFSSRQTYAANEISTSNAEFVDILLLIIIGGLSASIIAHRGFAAQSNPEPHYGLVMLMFLGFVTLIAFKGLTYSLVNWTFFQPDRGRNWLSAFFFSEAIVSMFAFPLALLCVFGPQALTNITYCLIGIVILQKIILLFKLYVNFRPKRYGCLLFFLYFCSVEIMPSLMAWHLLTKI